MPSVELAGLIALNCCWSKAASRGYQVVAEAQKKLEETKRATTSVLFVKIREKHNSVPE